MLRTWRDPSPDSQTAVCIVGEARTLIYHPVYTHMRDTLLHPSNGDLFLALSRTWSIAKSNSGRGKRPGATPKVITEESTSDIISVLRPVSSLIFIDDVEFAQWLSTYNGTRFREVVLDILADLRSTESWTKHGMPHPSCTWPFNHSCIGQPLSARMPDWHYYAHTDIFWAHLALALKWRVCLGMIKDAEALRRRPYEYMLRARPDWASSCLHSVAHFPVLPVDNQATWSLYWYDHAVLMPRSAAEVSLRQMPLAANVSRCPSRHTTEGGAMFLLQDCNRCIMELHQHYTLQVLNKNAGIARAVVENSGAVGAGVLQNATAMRSCVSEGLRNQITALIGSPFHGMVPNCKYVNMARNGFMGLRFPGWENFTNANSVSWDGKQWS